MSKRFTMDLPDEFVRVLEEIAQEEGLSKSDAIKRGIVLLKVAREETSLSPDGKERKLAISENSPDGTSRIVKEIVLPSIRRAR